MRRRLIILSLLMLGSLGLWFLLKGPQHAALYIGNQILRVELAQTSAQLSKGLGGRETIGGDGMLFILPTREVPRFWMAGMRFALDFVWIDGEKVIAITPNAPAEPNVPPEKLRIYTPNVPASKVLELPAGDSAKRGIKVGDPVKIAD